jgi:hypothetical protein
LGALGGLTVAAEEGIAVGIGMDVDEADEEGMVGAGLTGGGESVCRGEIVWNGTEVLDSGSVPLWRGEGEGNDADLRGGGTCA